MHIIHWVHVCSVAQSYPAHCGLMDCSLPGSAVRRIFQARILKWVAISSSRVAENPYHKWRWILSSALAASIEVITWISLVTLLKQCIMLIDFRVLSQPCLPGINSPWLPRVLLFTFCLIGFTNILLKDFYVLMRDIGPWFFFFLWYFVWFWSHKVNFMRWPHKILEKEMATHSSILAWKNLMEEGAS